MNFWIGVDIGGTKIAVAAVTREYDVLERIEIPTPRNSTFGDSILRSIDELIASLLSKFGSGLIGIGVGAGGQIDAARGVVLLASDIIPGWSGADIAGHLTASQGVPVVADNDVNVLAYGESLLGAGRGQATVVYLSLGTGVGGALVIDGKLHHGSHWTAGEFGHIIIDTSPDARRDLGGAIGTLEAYASGSGLAANYRQISGCNDDSRSGIEVGTCALNNPKSLEAEAVRVTGRYLGIGLTTLANALDPDIIVIGGGLVALGDLLLDPARAFLRERGLSGPNACPVVPAKLGRNAPVVGAAALAMAGGVGGRTNP